MTALAKVNTDNNNSNNTEDPYRGLLTAQDKVDQNLFYYKIITSPSTATNTETKIASTDGIQIATTATPGTAQILGINYEYMFNKAFGDDSSQWPEISRSTSSGANSAYINAMKPYVQKLIIPSEVILNSNGEVSSTGEKYKITEIHDLICPNLDGNEIDYAWGTGTSNYSWAISYLWNSPDLSVNVIIPEGIERIENFGTDDYTLTQFENDIRVSVKSVNFPKSLKRIGERCFYNYDGLTEVSLPSTLEYIGSQAFSECSNLIKVTCPFCQWGDRIYETPWDTYVDQFVGNGGSCLNVSKLPGKFYPFTLDLTIPSSVTEITRWRDSGALD